MRVLYILLIPFLLGACAPRAGSSEAYFSSAVFDSRPDWNKFIEIWYSGHLQALEEEPLPRKSSDKESEVYRFTCLRTFHPPFSIRVDVVEGGGGILMRKLSSGQGGYDPGSLKERYTMELSQQATVALREAIDTVGFWDMPTTKREGVGFDGSQWIVEAVRNGRYHVVDRWSPQPGTDMRGLGERFLALAAWNPEELY